MTNEPGNDERLPAGYDPLLRVRSERMLLDIEQARVEEQPDTPEDE